MYSALYFIKIQFLKKPSNIIQAKTEVVGTLGSKIETCMQICIHLSAISLSLQTHTHTSFLLWMSFKSIRIGVIIQTVLVTGINWIIYRLLIGLFYSSVGGCGVTYKGCAQPTPSQTESQIWFWKWCGCGHFCLLMQMVSWFGTHNTMIIRMLNWIKCLPRSKTCFSKEIGHQHFASKTIPLCGY